MFRQHSAITKLVKKSVHKTFKIREMDKKIARSYIAIKSYAQLVRLLSTKTFLFIITFFYDDLQNITHCE